ncbi:hypothetical protein ACFQV2_24450 [Actinokineospora soli]|uniref:Uncharacterized protein n=1 Tax=Actinokineospora soli TaxID=1048753 RepID=A0ABW2TTN4_9PSEU
MVEAEAGQVDRARAIVDSVGLPSEPRMIDDVLLPERRIRGLAQVAAALARAGEAEEALRTATEAEAAARGLVEEPRLDGLVSALAAARDFDRACAVARAVDCEPAVVEELVRALASSGRLGQAEGLAHGGLDGRTRSEIVRGWVVAGDLDEADAAVTRLFRRDLAAGQARLARDLATAGHHDRALTTAERIGADDVRAEAVAVVACALRRHGYLDRADSLAERAERWALALPGGAGVGVVRVFADHRDFDRAERLARALPHTALRDDEPVDPWEDEVLPRTLALSYLRTRLRAAGLTERAERIAAEVGPDRPRADPRNGLFAIPLPPRPAREPGPDEVRTALADGLWRDVVPGLPADALAALADEVLALPR